MDKDGYKILDIRGWGRLTGRGQPFFLEDADAAKAQDQMGDWLCSAVDACYNLQHPEIDLKALRRSVRDLTSQVRELFRTLHAAGIDKDDTNAADIEAVIVDLENRIKSLPEP